MKSLFSIPVLLLVYSAVSKAESFNPRCYASYASTSRSGSIPSRTSTKTVTLTHTRLHCTNGKTTISTPPVTYTSHVDDYPTTVPGTSTVEVPPTVTEYYNNTVYAHKTTTTTTFAWPRLVTSNKTTTTTIASRSGFVPIGSLDTHFVIGSTYGSGSYLASVDCTFTKSLTTYATKLCDVYTYTLPQETVWIESANVTYTKLSKTTTVTTPGNVFTAFRKGKDFTASGTSTYVSEVVTFTTSTDTNTVATEHAICNDPANYVSHYRYNESKLLPFYSVFQSSNVHTLIYLLANGDDDVDFAASPKECCERCASTKNCAGAIYNYRFPLEDRLGTRCAILTSGKTCRSTEKQWYGIASLDFQNSRDSSESWILMNGPCGRGGNILKPQSGCGTDQCFGTIPQCVFGVAACEIE